jgi:hypothetical protein
MSQDTPPTLQPPELKKSSNNGCIMAVVISIVVGIAVVMGGGYYAMMHTSLPFRPIETMINASGDAEIKGLTGSLSSGFGVEEFRVFDTGKSDTYFTGVSFKYNGARDFAGNSRFIVEEFAIKKVFISLPSFEEDKAAEKLRVDPAFHSSELDEALDNNDLDQMGAVEIKSLRIDEFVIENFAGEQKTGSVLMTGFKADKNGVTLGDLKVSGDYLELKLDTLPATNQYRQVIRGALKAAIDKSIRKDITFNIEFGGVGNAIKARYSAFDGKVVAEPGGDAGVRSTIDGLTISDYLDPQVVSLPADIRLVTTTAEQGKRTEVESGSFVLGKTRFEVDAQALIDGDDPETNKLMATAEIEGVEVMIRIAEPDSGERHFQYEFSGAGIAEADLPSRVLFGKVASALTVDEKQELELFASRHLKAEEEPESAPDTDPVPVPAPAKE